MFNVENVRIVDALERNERITHLDRPRFHHVRNGDVVVSRTVPRIGNGGPKVGRFGVPELVALKVVFEAFAQCFLADEILQHVNDGGTLETEGSD